jgi:hypothetical protein
LRPLIVGERARKPTSTHPSLPFVSGSYILYVQSLIPNAFSKDRCKRFHPALPHLLCYGHLRHAPSNRENLKSYCSMMLLQLSTRFSSYPGSAYSKRNKRPRVTRNLNCQSYPTAVRMRQERQPDESASQRLRLASNETITARPWKLPPLTYHPPSPLSALRLLPLFS